MSLTDLLPIPITALGVYFLIKLRLFFIIHPRRTVSRIKYALSDPRSKGALALALAGTLGIGNIVGVAYGLSVGGAGSLFWIFVSGLFSSVIKYAESCLCADFRDTGRGGMMYVMLKSFKKCGGIISKVYAVLCLFLSFSMGAALQAESAAAAARYAVGIKPYLFIIIFTIAVASVIRLGSNKIEKATATIIPVSTIIYIVLCLIVIFKNISGLSETMRSIINSAFRTESATGGVLAFLSCSALREGYARGLLSNEAGAGTSGTAQSRSILRPSDVGLLGICEVFFDTTLLCMLTGFAVLLSGAPLAGSGIEIVIAAFSSGVGQTAPYILFLLITLFAYSTVVCWYFYGCEALCFLCGMEGGKTYFVLFLSSVLIGALAGEALLIRISDYILFIMTALTLSTLLKNSERIKHLSEHML